MIPMNLNLFLSRILIVCFIFLPACGGGSSGGASTPALDALANQTATTTTLNTNMTTMVNSYDNFHNQYGNLTDFDDVTGQAVLDYYNKTLLPQLAVLQQNLDQLASEEQTLQGLIGSSSATQTLVADGIGPQKAFITELFVVGLFFTAVATAFIAVDNTVKSKVKAVENKIDNSIANGKSPAEAMNENRNDIRQTIGDINREVTNFIAVNSVTSGLSQGLSNCGNAMLNIFSTANDAQNLPKKQSNVKVKVIGHKNEVGPNELYYQTNGSNPSPIYFGETTDGSLNNIPLGDWDFVVFAEDHVRGTVKQYGIDTCSTNYDIPVNLNTKEEFEELTGGAPTTGTGTTTTDTSSTGTFTILSYVDRNGTIGTDIGNAPISISGSASFPRFSWSLSNVIAVDVVSQNGDFIYGIEGIEDDETDVIQKIFPPLTYGNYGVFKTEPLSSFSNPSPALRSGVIYIVQVISESGTGESVIFQVN